MMNPNSNPIVFFIIGIYWNIDCCTSSGIPPWLVRKTATTTQIISPTLPEYNEDTPLLVSSTRKSTTTTSFAASKIASPEVLKNGALRPTTMNLSKASSVYNPEIDFKEKQKIGSSTQSTVGSRPMSQQEECSNSISDETCEKYKEQGICEDFNFADKCRKTCNACELKMTIKMDEIEPSYFSRKWELDRCHGPSEFGSVQNNSEFTVYGERCCINPGEYVLICKNQINPFGWGLASLNIQGQQYCNDFVGFRAMRKVLISGAECSNTYSDEYCNHEKDRGYCNDHHFMENCRKTCGACRSICMDIKMTMKKDENQSTHDKRNWELGRFGVAGCHGPSQFASEETSGATAIIIQRCCIAPGNHDLFCRNTINPLGWGSASIEIQGQIYCDELSDGYERKEDVLILETFLDPTPECSCSEFMNENGFGRCIRLSGGKPVCYVNEPSNCTDLGFSKSTGKYYSWEACSYYKDVTNVFRPSDGCPAGTIDGLSTCYCEDYCNWNICRLTEPPTSCLASPYFSWVWMTDKEYWSVQVKYKCSSGVCTEGYGDDVRVEGTIHEIAIACALDPKCRVFQYNTGQVEHILCNNTEKQSTREETEELQFCILEKGNTDIGITRDSEDGNSSASESMEGLGPKEKTHKDSTSATLKDYEKTVIYIICGGTALFAFWYLLFPISELKKDPKRIVHRLAITFQIFCCFMAIYWTTLFSTQYGENSDAIFIAMKTYNENPTDKYPTFSVCFTGVQFHWYDDPNIYKTYGINATQYELMLKGKPSIRYERNDSFLSYSKTPVFLSDGSIEHFDQYHLNNDHFLEEIQLSYENSEDEIYNFNFKHSNTTPKHQLFVSYQTPETICFSRNDKDPLTSTRLHDLITLKSSVFQAYEYKNTVIQIFVHYPGQLMQSFDKPKYTASFEYFNSSLFGPNNSPGVLEFKISQSKTLRRRHDSKIPCNQAIANYDEYLQQQIIIELGCIPVYWRYLFTEGYNFQICMDPEKLSMAYHIISDVKKVLRLNDRPCDEMLLLASDSINYKPATRVKDMSIAFYYTEKMYEEIQYTKAMGFESWLSNVGGFVGIFLGYSMMQFPELIIWIFDVFYQRKCGILKGFFLDLARSSAKNDKNGELQRTDITDRTTEKNEKWAKCSILNDEKLATKDADTIPMHDKEGWIINDLEIDTQGCRKEPLTQLNCPEFSHPEDKNGTAMLNPRTSQPMNLNSEVKYLYKMERILNIIEEMKKKFEQNQSDNFDIRKELQKQKEKHDLAISNIKVDLSKLFQKI